MCTFVPFIFTKYELVKSKASLDLPVSSVDRLNLTEEQTKDINQLPAVPPLKKMCSGIRPSSSQSVDDQAESEEDTQTRTNVANGEKFSLQKTQVFESILSLLVKIYCRNQMEIVEKRANSSNIEHHFEFGFLKEKGPRKKAFNRIGDENDFILNLLEKASEACEKCKMNIEKSLETFNRLNKKPELETVPTSSSSSYGLYH